MEFGNKYDEVLIKYLLNESDATEQAFVEDWMKQTEENQAYLHKLANTLKLVSIKSDSNRIDIEAEWNRFRQAHLQDAATSQSESPGKDKVLSIVKDTASSGSRIYRLLIGGAVAASVIITLLFYAGVFTSQPGNRQVAVTKDAIPHQVVDSVEALTIHEVNSSLKTRSFNLPDGSLIQLYPASELTYREPTEGKSRLVQLSGKARFKVAKDKIRPFTVNGGPLSTTALGTMFTVTALPAGKQIIIRLNEGRVVVKSLQAINNRKLKDTYLLPGEELVYDVLKGTAHINLFDHSNANEKMDKIPADNPLISADSKRSWFMFNNQSLAQIFRMLEGMYDARINYSKDEVKKMYFIGTFSKSDSLELILKQIAAVNNLEVTRLNNSYTIKKQLSKAK